MDTGLAEEGLREPEEGRGKVGGAGSMVVRPDEDDSPSSTLVRGYWPEPPSMASLATRGAGDSFVADRGLAEAGRAAETGLEAEVGLVEAETGLEDARLLIPVTETRLSATRASAR